MRIQALKPFYGVEGTVRRGTVLDVTPDRANALVRNGLAVVVPQQRMAPAPSNKMRPEAETKVARPLDLTGSQTGAAKPASLSPAAPPPRRRLSLSPKAAQESS